MHGSRASFNEIVRPPFHIDVGDVFTQHADADQLKRPPGTELPRSVRRARQIDTKQGAQPIAES